MIHTLPIAKLDADATIPSRGSEHAAGLDLHSADWGVLAPGERGLFSTGIAVAIPNGHVGYIRPRSGLALKHGIDVLGGVIDSDYRGNVGVILINHGSAHFEVEAGDRIAQLVIHPLTQFEVHEVALVSELAQSARGTGGFGSTGVGVI